MNKKGVLLVNLGTPDQPTPEAVREYLKDFLGDPRVIDTNRFLWWPILHWMILPKRPQKSAELYAQIWTKDGSPLLIHTKRQTELLAELLPEYIVRYAMSYSTPRIPAMLTEMEEQGVEDLTIIPMYPQYSTTTTASIFDEVVTFYHKRVKMPSLRFVRDFYSRPDYVNALANKIKAKLAEEPVDRIVFSYHGIPLSYVTKGDIYPEQCENTTAMVMAQVGDVPSMTTYQSKFGKAEWLTPATDQTMHDLPKQGAKKILIVTPSFVADCLETLEEIEIENKGYFLTSGGEYFGVVSPFNDDPAFAQVLADITENK